MRWLSSVFWRSRTDSAPAARGAPALDLTPDEGGVFAVPETDSARVPEAVAASRSVLPEPTVSHPPAAHARRLLEWLQAPGKAGIHGGRREPVEMLYADLFAAYGEMCMDLGWTPAKWIPVSKALADLISNGVKTYCWRPVADGRKRFRCYLIPPPPLPEPVSSPVASIAAAREHRRQRGKSVSGVGAQRSPRAAHKRRVA